MGRVLRGRAHRHWPSRGAQDLAPGLQPNPRSGRAAAARGAGGVQDVAPQRRRRDRLGDHARRRLLFCHGVPRGDRARRAHLPGGEARRPPRAAHRRADRARHPGGARGERHPPRSQAGERPHPDPRRSEGLRQGARLRHRQERHRRRHRERKGHQRRSPPTAHQPGDDDGDARVHGAGAGGRAPPPIPARTSTPPAGWSTRCSPARPPTRGRTSWRFSQEGDHHAGAAVGDPRRRSARAGGESS